MTTGSGQADRDDLISGCNCGSGSDWRQTDWAELAEHYNRNQPSRNERMVEGATSLTEMRAFWGVRCLTRSARWSCGVRTVWSAATPPRTARRATLAGPRSTPPPSTSKGMMTEEQEALSLRARKLTEIGLARRAPGSLASVDKVAAMVLRLLKQGVPRDQVEWVIVNATVLTEGGIEFALGKAAALHEGVKPRVPYVKLEAPFRPSEEERERVRSVVSATREGLRGAEVAGPRRQQRGEGGRNLWGRAHVEQAENPDDEDGPRPA